MNREHIYNLIDAERLLQQDKWEHPHDWGQGDCSSLDVEPITKVAVLTEELGEVARAVLENDPESLRGELVQLGACVVAWLEAL